MTDHAEQRITDADGLRPARTAEQERRRKRQIDAAIRAAVAAANR